MVLLPVLAVLLWAAACSDEESGPGADGGSGDALARDRGGPDGPVAERGADAAAAVTCATGARSGAAGSTDGLTTAGNVRFNVRAPAGYKPTKGHPLVVVYAAAGGTPENMETFTGLTPVATAAGYIVAYVDHVSPADNTGMADVAKVPVLIEKKWCVDKRRIYLTGHSDGGSAIYIMLAYKYLSVLPAAIAPSAAGVSSSSFVSLPCLAEPLSVMVLHSKNDTLFPQFGEHARDWWVKCNACATQPGSALADGCVPYIGCSLNVEVQYCEGTGSHGTWPPLDSSMIAFFDRFSR